MLVVLATVSMLLTCNSGYSPGEMKVIIKKLGNVWVAYASFGGKPLHCVAKSALFARHGVYELMAGVAGHE